MDSTTLFAGAFLFITLAGLTLMAWRINRVHTLTRDAEQENESIAQRSLSDTREALAGLTSEFTHELELLRAGRRDREHER